MAKSFLNFQALGVAYSLDARQPQHRLYASYPMSNQERLKIRAEEKQRQAEWQADDQTWQLQHR